MYDWVGPDYRFTNTKQLICLLLNYIIIPRIGHYSFNPRPGPPHQSLRQLAANNIYIYINILDIANV